MIGGHARVYRYGDASIHGGASSHAPAVRPSLRPTGGVTLTIAGSSGLPAAMTCAAADMRSARSVIARLSSLRANEQLCMCHSKTYGFSGVSSGIDGGVSSSVFE